MAYPTTHTAKKGRPEAGRRYFITGPDERTSRRHHIDSFGDHLSDCPACNIPTDYQLAVAMRHLVIATEGLLHSEGGEPRKRDDENQAAWSEVRQRLDEARNLIKQTGLKVPNA